MGIVVENDKLVVDPGEPAHRQQFFPREVEGHRDQAKADEFEGDEAQYPQQNVMMRDQCEAEDFERLDDPHGDKKNRQRRRRGENRDESRDLRLHRRPRDQGGEPPAERDASPPHPGFEQEDRRHDDQQRCCSLFRHAGALLKSRVGE